MSPAVDNPFQASSASSRRGPPIPPGVWRAFLVRRGVRLLVLPSMLGLLTAVARQDLALPAWSVLAMSLGSAALWLPTSVWMAWARFLRPSEDERALLISTGEVLDRAAFLHLVAARSVEVALVLLAMWGMAGLFWLTLGWLWVLPVALICVAVSVWAGLRLRTQVWTARAAVRLAGGRVEEAADAVARGLQVRTGRRTSDTLRVLQIAVALRQGSVGRAREALEALVDPTWMNADVVAASLDREAGRPVPRALLEPPTDNVVRALELTRLLALNAVYDGRTTDALALLSTWDRHRRWLPRQHLVLLDLLEAAAHAEADAPAAARASLARSRPQPAERTWIAAVHPRWHALLQRVEERP